MKSIYASRAMLWPLKLVLGVVWLLFGGILLSAFTVSASAATLPAVIDLGAPSGPGTPLTKLTAPPLFNMSSSNTALASGDINADGLDDLVIGYGETETEGGATFAGSIVVKFGALEGRPEITPALALPSAYLFCNDDGALFGGSLAVGDVNGDGFDDIISGASLANSSTGVVVIFSGANLTPGSSFSVDTANANPNTSEARILGNQAGATFGHAVASADFDQDGKDDIVIGEPSADLPGQDESGRVYVIFGSTITFTSTTPIDDVANLWEIRGTAYDGLGASVATGDVTGDGLPDIVVGRPSYFFGFSGVVIVPAPTPMDKVLNLANPMDAATTVRFNGFFSMGTSVAVGEVDGDKYADILMSGPDSSLGGTTSGAAAIFSGVDAVIGEMYTISGAGDESKILFIGSSEGGNLGATLDLADIDGDGLDDALFSAPYADGPDGETVQFNTGRVYVYTGLDTLSGDIEIDNVPPNTLIYGETGFDYVGKSLHAGADLDSDGLTDLVTTSSAYKLSDDDGFGVVYAFYSGASEIDSAARIEQLKAGSIPRRGIGGRLSPTLGTFIEFSGGTAGTLSVERNRDKTSLAPLGIGGFADVCGSHWDLQTTRSGWGNAEIALEYSLDDIAGINPQGFYLVRYDAQDQSWSTVNGITHDLATRRVTFSTNQLGTYALVSKAPVITLNGDAEMLVGCKLDFNDPGATA
jgi:hypothetical protein